MWSLRLRQAPTSRALDRLRLGKAQPPGQVGPYPWHLPLLLGGKGRIPALSRQNTGS
jgi:hypothetical protein